MSTTSDSPCPGLAIVGTGFGCLTHLPAFRAAGFDIRALIGRDPAKTAERAARFDVSHAFTSMAEALDLPGIDAVSIATPPDTHLGLVLAAVAAGKHVVCEKPFALDAASARVMRDAADRAGVVHLVGTEFRFATGNALLRRVIADGAIGTPKLATLLMHIPLLADPAGEIPAWWGDAAAGGGWLGAQGSHLVDQIRSTLGEFEGVGASLTALSDRRISAEDTFTVHFRTVTGVDGVIQSSASSWGRIVMETRIAGNAGTVWLHGDDVWLADSSGRRKVEVPSDLRNPPPVAPPADLLRTAYDMLHFSGLDLAPYTRLAVEFRRRIEGLTGACDPAPATFEDGVAAMTVLDAIRLAAAERRWVAI